MKTKDIAGASIGLIALASHAGAGIVGYEKYTYDAAGNIVEKQIDNEITRFGYKNNTLMTSSQGTAYLHDDAGRLLGESRKEGPARSLSYQYGDKVTEVEKGGTQTGLFYNADGQLVGKETSGQAEVFAWDGLGLVMRNGQTFANEGHLVGGMPAITNDEVTVSDHLGSTLSVGGRCFAATAFGKGLERVFFTGKPFVGELDSFVFKCRNYSAENGRWNFADSYGFPDGINNYSYVKSDPINKIDPYGLYEKSATDTFSGTVSWGVAGNPGYVSHTLSMTVYTTYDSIPYMEIVNDPNVTGEVLQSGQVNGELNHDSETNPTISWREELSCPAGCVKNYKLLEGTISGQFSTPVEK